MLRFGFVGTYLSEPLVRAYTTAAAAHAVVAQLKYMFGVSPTRFSGPLALVYVSTGIIKTVGGFFGGGWKLYKSNISINREQIQITVPCE